MTDIVKRLRNRHTLVADQLEAADEIERLRAVEALYEAGKDQWNPVYKIVLDERDRLRDEIERYKKSFQVVLDHILKHEPKP